MINSGRIIKAVGGKFKVLSDNKIYDCFSRGIIKRDNTLIVGDIVDYEDRGSEKVITKVRERENSLIRPPVSNIDNVLIVIAPVPKPDFMLIDKLIINCHKEDIEPILCYNKTDINDTLLVDKIKNMYENIIKLVFISARTNVSISDLKALLRGKFTCFAGQSAVGKSTIINAIATKDIQETGDLSRIERGRNTTRHVEIFNLGEDIMVADTCGFSSLTNVLMPPDELSLYYDEYVELASNCKYTGCSHTSEPNCAVKDAVKNSRLDADRYNRYIQLYNEIKIKWSRRYE